MSFADNWARVFVVITFLTFGEAQIIGGIVPNLTLKPNTTSKS